MDKGASLCTQLRNLCLGCLVTDDISWPGLNKLLQAACLLVTPTRRLIVNSTFVKRFSKTKRRAPVHSRRVRGVDPSCRVKTWIRLAERSETEAAEELSKQVCLGTRKFERRRIGWVRVEILEDVRLVDKVRPYHILFCYLLSQLPWASAGIFRRGDFSRGQNDDFA